MSDGSPWVADKLAACLIPGKYRPVGNLVEAMQLLGPARVTGIDVTRWRGGRWCAPVGAVGQCVILLDPDNGGELDSVWSGDWVVREGDGLRKVPGQVFAEMYETVEEPHEQWSGDEARWPGGSR